MTEIVLSRPSIEKIRRHPLYSKDKMIVIGRGNPNKPEFLIFGEAPGKKENIKGVPFVGRAGAVLELWIKETDIRSVYISNVVPLLPLNNQNKIRKPTKVEVAYFKFFVNCVIEMVDPEYLITLGDSATLCLTEKSVKSIIGLLGEYSRRPLTALYHPARYIRLGRDKSDGLSDFTKAVKLLRKK